MEKDLIKQFNLPTYVNGKSFAEASKAIDKKFEGRNDATSLKTKEELLSRLAGAQEFVRMKEGLADNSMNVNQAAGGSFLDMMGGAQGAVGLANSAFGTMNDIFGKSQVDTSGASGMTEQKNVALSGITGAAQGAMEGAKIGGPVGAVIGGVVKGAGSIIGAGKHNKLANMGNLNSALASRSDITGMTTYSLGSYLTDPNPKYSGYDMLAKEIGYTPPNPNVNPVTPPSNTTAPNQVREPNIRAEGTVMPGTYNSIIGSGMPTKRVTQEQLNNAQKSINGERLDSALGKAGDLASMVGRVSPILSNLFTKIDKPNTRRGVRLGNQYDAQPFDTNALINQVNQNNISGAVAEMSGGDLGAARTNMLAGSLNRDKALANAFIQGDQINREENRVGFETGLRRDIFNAGQEERFIERKAQDDAAYTNAKLAQRAALFEDIAGLAKESEDTKLVRDMFGYTWDGKYYVDKKGNKYTPQEVATQIKTSKENESKYGGKLNYGSYSNGGYLKKK